jgi:hypothetical protein
MGGGVRTQVVYDIRLIHEDRGDWEEKLMETLAEELRLIGLHHSVAVRMSAQAPSPDRPSVGLYLGSENAAGSAVVQQLALTALEEGPVIPVVADLRRFGEETPPALSPINGMAWSATGVARALLEELGIEERQRKVFISHRREDGLGAAEQLHDHLSHMGFDPFIDRFAIRTGAAVQERIADALEEHAFLLLLETPSAADSDWVFFEIDYALSHTMGTLIIRWPDDPPPIPGSPGLPRIPLSAEDLVSDDHGYDILTDAALDRLVGEIEAAHASGLVRRRRMLIQSIEDAATAAGCTSLMLPHWRVRVESAETSTLLGTTPRLPTAHDLQVLDQAREEPAQEAVLIHSARLLSAERRDHLRWVAGERDLVIMPENAIGARWTTD